MKHLITILISTVTFSLAAQNLYFPPLTGDAWTTTNPVDLGYCSNKVDSLYHYLESNNSKAFILLKDGKIVLEKYFGTFTVDSNWYWASAGKTLMAGLVGIAKDDNLLDLTDKTSEYLGDGWTSSSPTQESRITLWNQLTMTTGLDDGNGNADCTKPECLTYLTEPGSRWAYHNAPYTLLGAVLENASGESLNAYFRANLGSATGMNGGFFTALTYNRVFVSTPRSMARYGLLLLADGFWRSDPVIDNLYIQDLHTASQDMNPAYGFLTWLNGTEFYRAPQTQFQFPGYINPDAPEDMYAALGKNGQVLNVVPSQNLVWLRMGDAPQNSNGLITATFNNEVWKYINDLQCSGTSVSNVSNSFPAWKIQNDQLIFLELDAGTTHITMLDIIGTTLTQISSQQTEIVVPMEGFPSTFIIRLENSNGVSFRKLHR